VDEMDEESLLLVDWDFFVRTRAELGAGFARILSYFREDGEKAVAKIEAAMHARDTSGLVLPAHTMKSEARQFGAERLGALAEEIEVGARRAIEGRFFPDELTPQVARLRPLYAKTMAVLDAEANPLRQRHRAAS
jgi:HPt (histidine-containing phosphotransfer) domain-containing protein